MKSDSNPLKSTLTFTVLGFVRPGLAVLLLPIYLRYLSPSDYGVLALISVFSTSLSLVGNLGLDSALRTKYFDYYQDVSALSIYLKNIFSFVLLLALIWLAVFSLIGPSLFSLIFIEEPIGFYPYGLIACVGALSTMCQTPFFIYLRNKQALKSFTTLTLIIIVTSVLLQLYLVTFWDAKVLGILIGNAVPNALMLLYLVFKYKLILRKSDFDREMIKSSLKFSLPLIPYVFLDLLITRGDRYFVGIFTNLKQVGLYALLMTIVALIDIVLNALDNALRPVLYDLFKKGIPENRKVISKYFSFYVIFGVISLYGLFVAGNHLEYITSKTSYLSIKQYFGLATICMVPLLYARIFNLQLMYFGKSKEISWLTFYKTLLVVSLFFFLIPAFELWGALVAILISNTFSLIIFWFKSRNLLGSVYNLKIYISLSLYFLLSVISFQMYNLPYPSILMLIQFVVLLVVSGWIYIKINHVEGEMSDKNN